MSIYKSTSRRIMVTNGDLQDEVISSRLVRSLPLSGVFCNKQCSKSVIVNEWVGPSD